MTMLHREVRPPGSRVPDPPTARMGSVAGRREGQDQAGPAIPFQGADRGGVANRAGKGGGGQE